MAGHYDVVVVGGGFAGSILARVLARQGHAVALLEAARHPRFALGESSTPLAALALERLARRWDLPDLHALAAWGRWRRDLSELGRGLKRGFTFYRHRAGQAFDVAALPAERLLVAASPSDDVADCHWLRADVDAHLFARAGAAGVDAHQEARVVGCRATARGLEIDVLEAGGNRQRIETPLAIDASGPGGAVARWMGAVDGAPLRTSSGLVFSHFEGLLSLPEAVDAPLPGRTPFPEQHAAVHHLLDEGWIYELRFDHGVTSAGLLVAGGLPPGASAATLWSRVVGRYPTVARQLAPARLLRPLAAIPAIQRRLDRAAGASWAALPHTAGFVDPLFSTGIAWSLLAVERLADVLAVHPPGSAAVRDGSAFRRYAALLAAELEQVDHLVAGAYAARRELELFVGQTMLYFTLVSFAEAGQRLLDPEGACWNGLLRADRAGWRRVFTEAFMRVRTAAQRPAPDVLAAHAAWIAEVTAEVNIAGLCRPGERLYGVDFDALVANAPRLGLSAAEVRTALPRLRGAAVS